jgi:hypothetical protein
MADYRMDFPGLHRRLAIPVRFGITLTKIAEELKECVNYDEWQYHSAEGANGYGA